MIILSALSPALKECWHFASAEPLASSWCCFLTSNGRGLNIHAYLRRVIFLLSSTCSFSPKSEKTPETRPPPALIAEAVQKRLSVWFCLSSTQVLTDFSRPWTPALIFPQLSYMGKKPKIKVTVFLFIPKTLFGQRTGSRGQALLNLTCCMTWHVAWHYFLSLSVRQCLWCSVSEAFTAYSIWHQGASQPSKSSNERRERKSERSRESESIWGDGTELSVQQTHLSSSSHICNTPQSP